MAVGVAAASINENGVNRRNISMSTEAESSYNNRRAVGSVGIIIAKATAGVSWTKTAHGGLESRRVRLRRKTTAAAWRANGGGQAGSAWRAGAAALLLRIRCSSPACKLPAASACVFHRTTHAQGAGQRRSNLLAAARWRLWRHAPGLQHAANLK